MLVFPIDTQTHMSNTSLTQVQAIKWFSLVLQVSEDSHPLLLNVKLPKSCVLEGGEAALYEFFG